MAVHGRIECRINSGTAATTDYFVTLHNFLLSLPGDTRISCNFGSGGTGIDYRDAPTTIGTNAFAVFRFGNATTPFNVLIQCINTTGSGTTIASPGNYAYATTNNYGTSVFGVMIVVAQRADGTNAWGGGTANVGADTKSTPVWTAGSSTLNVWPRINSSGGTFATNREALMMLSTVNAGATEYYNDIFTRGIRVNFIADDDNLLIVWDMGSDGSYQFWYFGKYTPRAALNIQTPYVCIHMGTPRDPIVSNFTYGSTTQVTNGDFTTAGDGGVAHPTAASGIKNVLIDGTASLFNSSIYNPNRAAGLLGRFDLPPAYVAVNEAPFFGMLGSINFFRTAYNLPSLYMSPDRKLAIFGNGSVQSGKIVVPWDGLTVPGSGINRAGISF